MVTVHRDHGFLDHAGSVPQVAVAVSGLVIPVCSFSALGVECLGAVACVSNPLPFFTAALPAQKAAS